MSSVSNDPTSILQQIWNVEQELSHTGTNAFNAKKFERLLEQLVSLLQQLEALGFSQFNDGESIDALIESVRNMDQDVHSAKKWLKDFGRWMAKQMHHFMNQLRQDLNSGLYSPSPPSPKPPPPPPSPPPPHFHPNPHPDSRSHFEPDPNHHSDPNLGPRLDPDPNHDHHPDPNSGLRPNPDPNHDHHPNPNSGPHLDPDPAFNPILNPDPNPDHGMAPPQPPTPPSPCPPEPPIPPPPPFSPPPQVLHQVITSFADTDSSEHTNALERQEDSVLQAPKQTLPIMAPVLLGTQNPAPTNALIGALPLPTRNTPEFVAQKQHAIPLNTPKERHLSNQHIPRSFKQSSESKSAPAVLAVAEQSRAVISDFPIPYISALVLRVLVRLGFENRVGTSTSVGLAQGTSSLSNSSSQSSSQITNSNTTIPAVTSSIQATTQNQRPTKITAYGSDVKPITEELQQLLEKITKGLPLTKEDLKALLQQLPTNNPEYTQLINVLSAALAQPSLNTETIQTVKTEIQTILGIAPTTITRSASKATPHQAEPERDGALQEEERSLKNECQLILGLLKKRQEPSPEFVLRVLRRAEKELGHDTSKLIKAVQSGKYTSRELEEAIEEILDEAA
jgi:hypothetical protein